MAKITPTQNTSSQNQDPIVLSTSATGQLKRSVDGSALTPTGSDYPAAAQMTGSHVISGESLVATDVFQLVGGVNGGGTAFPLEGGTATYGSAIVLHVRETGPATSLAVHAVNVTSGTAELGTAISSGRKHIEFYNAGTGTVYLGPSTVGTATGFPLGSGVVMSFNSAHRWYATIINAAGTSAIRVLEMS